MVASIQNWKLIHTLSNQKDVIQRGDICLYLLPWMDLTSRNSSPEQRQEWIIREVLNVINNNNLNGNDITILVHANDYWANGPGILEQNQLPDGIRENVRRCILYRRDSTVVYEYLTTRRNIQSDSYLSDIEGKIYDKNTTNTSSQQ